MARPLDPRLFPYFDVVLRKIREHPTYAKNMDEAARRQDRLVLDYHTHGPGQGYCVAILARRQAVPLLEIEADPSELVHIRGIAEKEEDCGPLMGVFRARLQDEYRLEHEPQIYLNGEPFQV